MALRALGVSGKRRGISTERVGTFRTLDVIHPTLKQ